MLPRVGSSNKTSKKKEKMLSFKIQKQNHSKGSLRSCSQCSLTLLCYEADGGHLQQRTGSTRAHCSRKHCQLGNYLVNCDFWDLNQPCSRRRIPSKKKQQQKANNPVTLDWQGWHARRSLSVSRILLNSYGRWTSPVYTSHSLLQRNEQKQNKRPEFQGHILGEFPRMCSTKQ